MSYHYILHEKGQEEYEEALNWYLDRSLQAAVYEHTSYGNQNVFRVHQEGHC
jgi:hypothetical protein